MKKKRVFALLLSIVMIAVMVLGNPDYSTKAASDGFSGSGSGTSSDPYIITNVQQLKEIKNAAYAYYELGNDIDLSGINWEPITWFQGSLDGKGHKIINMTINVEGEREDLYYIGFFESISGANIRGIAFENVNISENIKDSNKPSDGFFAVGCGIISGCARNESIISECSVEGKIKGTYKDVSPDIGALAGFIKESSSVNNSYVNAQVDVTIDSNNYGDVSSCIGWLENSSINNCLINGKVIANGRIYATGIAGHVYTRKTVEMDTLSTVKNNVVALTELSSDLGIYAIANGDEDSDISNNLALDADDSRLKDKDTFIDLGWDFDGTWTMGYSHPELSVFKDNTERETTTEPTTEITTEPTTEVVTETTTEPETTTAQKNPVTVTIHFKNTLDWENVGVWAYEGWSFIRQAMPQQLCPAYNTKTDRALWPGAKMTKESDYDGWYSIKLTFEDTSHGAVMIFNNLVADTKADTSTGGDETDQDFYDGAKANGLICDTSQKRSSANQLIMKNFESGEYWCERWCDVNGNILGSAALLSESKPDSYKKMTEIETTTEREPTTDKPTTESSYSIVGPLVSSVVGADNMWDAASAVDMTKVEDNSQIYTLTIKDVQPGKYQYQILKNHSWTNKYSGTYFGDSDYANLVADVKEKTDVTVTLDLDKMTVKTNLDVDTPPVDTQPVDVSKAKVTLLEDKVVYNGNYRNPKVTSVYLNGIRLTEGIDYYVGSVSASDAKVYKVTVHGKGNYYGSVTVNYTITPKDISTAKIELAQSEFTYNGENPWIIIEHIKVDGKELEADTDYDFTWPDDTKIGEYEVVLYGKGNYTGTAKTQYRIISKNVEKKSQNITVKTKSIKSGTKGILLGAETSGDGRLTYKSGNKSVITIDSNGVMNARKPGKSVITVTASETTKYKKATKKVTITVLPKEKQVISVKSVPKIYTGKSSLDIKAKAKGDVKLKYSVDNKKIASVDNKGLVKLKGCGNLKITITAPETASYKKATKIITTKIRPQKVSSVRFTSPGKGRMSVSWAKDNRATGYIVVFSKDSSFSESMTRTVQTSRTSLSYGNMPGMCYYVKVRSSYKAGLYLGEWSEVKKVFVK